MKGLVFREKPRGLLRTLFRLPTYLYRMDLGWLLGRRFLMVTHRGRKSGLLHHTVLEVLQYDPKMQESIVLAALGERADWYRNIQTNSPLQVQTGRLRYVPQYRLLTPEEAYRVWSDFEESHPFEARVASWVLGWKYDGTPAGREMLAHTLRLVAFRPGAVR
ncbi:MAG: nitroreductase family deazaflavin-dependent oxidoreductase [Chloroflexota bacterium]|nr:nitroreductase family deazaflavin-dependent oxidoreductase [Chloroflexota bacterium]